MKKHSKDVYSYNRAVLQLEDKTLKVSLKAKFKMNNISNQSIKLLRKKIVPLTKELSSLF